MNQTEYARARGVNPSSIFSAVQRGLIRLKPDGEIDPEQADATWYRRHLQRQDGRRSGAETEARREKAVTQSTAAKIVMTRRNAEELRDAVVERDKSQAEVGSAVRLTGDALGKLQRRLGKSVLEAITEDIGDLQVEAIRVTR